MFKEGFFYGERMPKTQCLEAAIRNIHDSRQHLLKSGETFEMDVFTGDIPMVLARLASEIEKCCDRIGKKNRKLKTA